MKILEALNLDKYSDTARYTLVEGNIYEDVTGGIGGKMGITKGSVYCLSLYCELEEPEDTQYPLGDILDKYFVNCTDLIEENVVDGKRMFTFEVEGESLDAIKEIAGFVGRRAYNYEEGGYIKLAIE